MVVSVVAGLCLFANAATAQVERIWLTHRSQDPSRIVVSWTTVQPGDSVVEFGLTEQYGRTVRRDESTTLHHVEIELAERDATYFYRVSSGDQRSAGASFKAYPTEELRLAVVANWQGRPDLTALRRDNVHLLLTAGDNIASIHRSCGTGQPDCIAPYAELIDAYPELFRSTPFLPVLGNHDKEIRPRGNKPPAEPVYDLSAAAYRRFFELPGEEWKWRFDIPEFGLRLLALDLNHVSDVGTTWQSCHAFDADSAQLSWCQEIIANSEQPFVVTLFNEKNSTVRGLAQGAWGKLVSQGTLAVTGFGHFAERAMTEDFAWYNTSLQGRGDRYPDPQSTFLESQDNYLLLTCRRDAKTITVEVKNLAGHVLDRHEHSARRRR